MILTTLIKRQLRIFAVLTLVALFFAVVVYARVPALLAQKESLAVGRKAREELIRRELFAGIRREELFHKFN